MNRIASIAGLMILAAVLLPAVAHAQLRPMGPPLNTTLVLQKPAPGEIFGDKKVIHIGVGKENFKFILKDGLVDDPEGRVVFDDIWQQVRQSDPNFVVAGQDADSFAKIKPGDTVTIKGMYTPLGRNFEVGYMQPGEPTWEQQGKHY